MNSTIKIEKVKLADLKPHPKNPKLHAEELIEESITEAGYVEPIVVDENNQILAGHGRVKVMTKMGFEDADVVRKEGLTEEQKVRYMLRSNKLVERGGYDWDILKSDFTKDELLMSGFTEGELGMLADPDGERDKDQNP